MSCRSAPAALLSRLEACFAHGPTAPPSSHSRQRVQELRREYFLASYILPLQALREITRSILLSAAAQPLRWSRQMGISGRLSCVSNNSVPEPASLNSTLT